MSNLIHTVRDIWANTPNSVRRLLPILVLCCFLAPKVLSSGWTGNEVFYYGIADRWVRPDLYPTTHAIFDDSIARIVSFYLIGSVIYVLGFESAEIWLSAIMLVVYAVAFWRLAKALDLTLLGALLCLSAFLIAKQSLLSGSYIFGGVEPKVFAYCCVLIGVSYGLNGQRFAAIFWMTAATYFHFLIGAFWGGMILWLFVIQTRSWLGAWRETCLFTILCLPLATAIAFERFAGGPLDTSALDMSLAQIYAEFRHPHHLVPFFEPRSFLENWLPGVVTHTAIGTGILIWMYRPRMAMEHDAVAIWIASLNFYIPIALVIAFFDRSTHYFSALFLFRPAALVLLLTFAWVLGRLAIATWVHRRERLNSLLFAVFMIAVTGQLFLGVQSATIGRTSLSETQTFATASMIEWIRTHTPTDSLILISAAPTERMSEETRAPWVGIERLMERSTLVSFKYVPTTDSSLLKWYQLLRWRDGFFAGSCRSYGDIQIDYLVIAGAQTVENVKDCSVTVWRDGDYFVQKVTNLKTD